MPASQLPAALQERVAYDSLELPFYICRVRFSSYCPSLCHPCHWHEDLEFCRVIEGHMHYSVDGRVYPLEEGDGIFVNSNHLHFCYSPDGTDCVFATILVPLSLLCASRYIERSLGRLLREPAAPAACALKHDDPHWQKLRSLMAQVTDIYCSRREGYELEVVGCYFAMAAELMRGLPRNEAARGDEGSTELGALKAMLRYIDDNLSEKLTLKDIAGSGCVCESKCHRLFRRYLTRSPLEFVYERRLERGCELLRDSALPVTEIAGRLGFSSPSHFSRRFGALYGLSPSDYRQKYGHGQEGGAEGGERNVAVSTQWSAVS